MKCMRCNEPATLLFDNGDVEHPFCCHQHYEQQIGISILKSKPYYVTPKIKKYKNNIFQPCFTQLCAKTVTNTKMMDYQAFIYGYNRLTKRYGGNAIQIKTLSSRRRFDGTVRDVASALTLVGTKYKTTESNGFVGTVYYLKDSSVLNINFSPGQLQINVNIDNIFFKGGIEIDDQLPGQYYLFPNKNKASPKDGFLIFELDNSRVGQINYKSFAYYVPDNKKKGLIPK